MWKKKVFISCLLLVIPNLIWGFSHRDIHPIFTEIMSQHIKYKEFNETLAKRTIGTMIDRFDPLRLYFLEEDIRKFVRLSEEECTRLVEEYNGEKFSTYKKIYKKMQMSIDRARKIRDKLQKKLLQEEEYPEITSYEAEKGFAKTQDRLENFIENRIVYYFNLYAKKLDKKFLNKEEKERVFAFYEKQRKDFEDKYYAGYGQFDEKFSLQLAKSICMSLDPHTMVYSSEEAAEFRHSLQKEFVGLGIYVRDSVDGVKITRIVATSPASRILDLEAGDSLEKIDTKDIKNWQFQHVLRKLEGKSGSSITISVRKQDGTQKEILLQRDKVTLEPERISVDYEHFGKGVLAKIEIRSFYDNRKDIQLCQDVQNALQALQEKGPILGLVIDLRKNMGGFFHQAVKTAQIFGHHDAVIVAKYKDREVEYKEPTLIKEIYSGPTLLLMSKISASAAEIFAQSLRDTGAAVVVGDEHSYGKGSMQHQTVTDIDAKYFYKVTIGRYYTPSGHSIQVNGVHSDILVPTQYSKFTLGERFLRYHLEEELWYEGLPVQKDLQEIFYKYQSRLPTAWEKMLPTLLINSQERQKIDANNQAFIEFIQGNTEKSEYGRQDIPLKEAIEILKDIAFLSM